MRLVLVLLILVVFASCAREPREVLTDDLTPHSEPSMSGPECERDRDCPVVACETAPCPTYICINGACMASVTDEKTTQETQEVDYQQFASQCASIGESCSEIGGECCVGLTCNVGYGPDDALTGANLRGTCQPADTTLPLGDQKVSTTAKKGYIYACQTSFTGGGAMVDGEWIEADTWDPSGKPTVDGDVAWESTFHITDQENDRFIAGNGLPSHHTGSFPIASNDDAYAYDRNPNFIQVNDIQLHLPLDPQIADEPSCVGMGMIGVMISGAALFNGFDAGGRDAPAHEIQDACGGHPQQEGVYHYHDASPCLPQEGLVGYALDGFPIYGMIENGKIITNDDLDECHGKVVDGEYRYYLTREYPYSIGCFKGTPVETQEQTPAQQQGPPQGGPPQEAKDACSGKSDGASCTFQAPDRTITGTCRNTPNGMACVP